MSEPAKTIMISLPGGASILNVLQLAERVRKEKKRGNNMTEYINNETIQSKDTNSETIEEPKPESPETNTGGLGMNPGYSAVTATYKRAEKRRRRKFDEWWKSSH